MEINPQRQPQPPSKSKGIAKSRGAEQSSEAGDLTDVGTSGFAGSELQAAIRDGLDALPEVRNERVEDGRILAQDPDYPNPEEMDEVGQLAVRQFLGESLEDGGESEVAE